MPTSPAPSRQPTQTDQTHIELSEAAATVARMAQAAAMPNTGTPPETTADDLVNALTLLHRLQNELTTLEPALIAAARHAGASWQTLAPALGVASRQAAERRYLRLAPTAPTDQASTADERVRAERDRRAGHRAVAQWANNHTADLRRLAGQITGLTDLDNHATEKITRLHHALADTDASALPALLADARQHLHHHPDLADQITTITTHTDQVRRDTQHNRNHST